MEKLKAEHRAEVLAALKRPDKNVEQELEEAKEEFKGNSINQFVLITTWA